MQAKSASIDMPGRNGHPGNTSNAIKESSGSMSTLSRPGRLPSRGNASGKR